MKNSILTGAVGLAALALAGCGDTGSTNAADAGNNAATTADSGDKPATAAPADPALAGQIAAAVEQLNRTTPIRVDDITTVTSVRSNGTEIIYDMAISQALPMSVDQARTAMQANNQANMCRDPNTSRLIGSGGSMRHVYTDSGGQRFETQVTSCP